MADKIKNLSGREINGFRLLRELGRGSTGIVYLASQLSLEREVAFKYLSPEYSGDAEYIQNFMHEAKSIARLDHRNIVRAIDAGRTQDGILYLVMEYIKGKSLEDIRRTSPDGVPLSFLLDITIQLADAMHYAWSRFHLLHGDIKPGNLLICDSDRSLKLADLGLASVAGSDGDSMIMATPMYASPEVITGDRQNISVKSDLYSFGVMFYELAGGTAPFHGDINTILHRHLEEFPRPLTELNPALDRDISDFVARLLSKDPAERPADWLEVKEFARRSKDKLRVKAISTNTPIDLQKLTVKVADDAPLPAKAKKLIAVTVSVAAAVILLLLGLLIAVLNKQV